MKSAVVGLITSLVAVFVIISMISGCNDAPVEVFVEALVLDPAEVDAANAWLDFEDTEFDRDVLRMAGSTPWSVGERVPPIVGYRTAQVGEGFANVAFTVRRIPGTHDVRSQDRRCFGAQIYYYPDERLRFTGAVPNDNHHEWAMWGTTVPEQRHLDAEGRVHFRIIGIAANNIVGIDDFARLFMLPFVDEGEGAGSQTLWKIDNRGFTGWCLMDGTLPLEHEVEFHGFTP